MTIFSTLRFGVLALLLFSCSKAEEDSQEIDSESFRAEVAATEVFIATAERKRVDYLINATGKLEALSEVKALVE